MTMYRDPRRGTATDHGIIAALMRTPTTPSVMPEENQFSEALCWALRRVPGLARRFAGLFVAGDAEAEAALEASGRLRVETRVTGFTPGGAVVYPDISICGEDRAFQLLVEGKVHSTFHEYRLGDGTVVSQPVVYALALEHEPEHQGAGVRRVGTLSIDPAGAPADTHPLRCADVSWECVRDLLADHAVPEGLAIVVDELVEAITSRLLHPRPTYESAAHVLRWGDQVLPDVLSALAAAVGGATSRQINQGKAEVYRGGFVTWTLEDGTKLNMWAYVSPEGGGYSLPGEPDALYLQPDQGGAARHDPALGGRLDSGFMRERDLAGWETWHAWLPVDEIQAAGDLENQVDLVVSRFTDALAASGLIPDGSVPPSD